MSKTTTPGEVASSDQLGLVPKRGLLDRLQGLKVLLGTDAPEVRGWAPVVQQEAQATVNAAIAALKDMNSMSERLEQTAEKLADDNERLRALAEHLRHCRECGETDVANCVEGEPLWDACMPQAAAEIGGA